MDVNAQNKPIFWSRKSEEYLIQLYKQNELLYDSMHKDFYNQPRRTEAYKSMLQKMKKYIPKLQMEDIRTKINSMREQVANEFYQIEDSEASGTKHVPELWCFDQLKFLLNHTTGLTKDELNDMDESMVEVVLACPNESVSEPKKRVRKLKEKWTSELTEKLVQEVEAREGTWNFLSKEYRDRSLREALWQDVADAMKMPRSEVATKWNSLRCSFRAAFNRRGQRKGGKTEPINPIYNCLKFLEPTLQIQASATTTNFKNECPSPLASSGSPSDAEANLEMENTLPTTSTPRALVKRRRVEKDDDEYSKVVERALETLAACNKCDAWTDVGDFVASNGRVWAVENPQLANEFKTNIYELILRYQKKATRPT